MASIDLRAAAIHHVELQHQIDAWAWLQGTLSDEVIDEFARRFRSGSAPPAPAPVPGGCAVDLVLPMIRHFEGFSADAYPDPLSGGEPITIGYGTTMYPDGRKVRMGDRVTREQAEGYLWWYANWCETVQRERIPTWRQMRPHEQAAILGFAFNLGANFFGSHGFATLTARLRDGEWSRVPEALLLYVNPGSSVEAGLRRRRQAEGDLFSTGTWSMA